MVLQPRAAFVSPVVLRVLSRSGSYNLAMGQYRNLIQGTFFGLSMVLGAIAGVYSTMPIVIAIGPNNWFESQIVIAGTVLGAMLGGTTWKVFSRKRTFLQAKSTEQRPGHANSPPPHPRGHCGIRTFHP
jgi:hypothetical protein